MIQILPAGEQILKPIQVADTPEFREELNKTLWIDLLNPTDQEDHILEKTLDLYIPSHEEMHEISESSRLFEENGALYLSCWMLAVDSTIPHNTSVTFVVTPKHFVSIRYADHHAFRIFKNKRRHFHTRRYDTPAEPLADLLQAVIGHIASMLRLIEQDLHKISLQVFSEKTEEHKYGKVQLKKIVQRLGKRNSLVSSLRECSVSLSALMPYLRSQSTNWVTPETANSLQTMERDIKSLREYDDELASEISFLLDSTVGLINFEQNQSMKVLSIAAVLVAFV